MASELSRFIEDELRKQGINDDEEQRLLSNLRVKPLSVQATTPAAQRGWSTKQKIAAAAGLAVVFGALVALVITTRGQPMTTGNFRGAIADPEAGVEPLPMPEQTKAEKKTDAAAKGEPKPPQEPAPDQQAAATQEDTGEDDYEDYEQREKAVADAKKKEEQAKKDKAAADKAAADKAKQAAAKKEAATDKPAGKADKAGAAPAAEGKGKQAPSEDEEQAAPKEPKTGGRRLQGMRHA